MFPAELTQCSQAPWFLAYVAVAWAFGIGVGFTFGRTVKTKPIEIERDQARDDLNTLRDAIEIVQKK